MADLQALCFSGEICVGVAYYDERIFEDDPYQVVPFGSGVRMAAGEWTGDPWLLNENGVFLGMLGLAIPR